MIKILPFIIVPLFLVLGFGMWRLFHSDATPKTPEVLENLIQKGSVEVPKTVPTATTQENVETLQSAVDTLVKEINLLKDTNSALDAKIKNLEKVDLDLADAISEETKASSSSSTADSTSKSVSFISLGSGGSGDYSNFTTLNDYQITLDPADFPGYTGIVLEVIFRVVDSISTVSVRLYNTADSSAVSTEVSTKTSAFSLGASSSFKLAEGRKTYALQAKNSDGKTFYIQLARLRVNYN